MSRTTSDLPLCLAVPRSGGWNIINYDTGERLQVRVSPLSLLPKNAFNQEVYDLQGGADQLCVFHLPFRGDLRVFQIVDELIADAFDLPARFFAAEYKEGFSYGGSNHLGSAEAAEKILNALGVGHSHVVPRAEWVAMKNRHVGARLTITGRYLAVGEAV